MGFIIRMANYKTQAINLKSYNLGEADKIVVMYSRDYGIIRCVAKGIKRPASKLGGRMEMLASNKLLIAKGK
jgi:DNA repair protein RecO (recombination protein O)